MFGCRRCCWGADLELLRCFSCSETEPLSLDYDLRQTAGVTALRCGCRRSSRGPLLAGSGAVSLECACAEDSDEDDGNFFDLNFELADA